ncbi:filamentous haemagglutinin outer membrane protein (plasmid) [Calothrix sp. PCC 7716]|nr:filamentous haemagglutinin outer membrane protein [Calothrix sp. PCC 7716]
MTGEIVRVKSLYKLGFIITASFQAFLINPCFAQSSNIVPDNSLGAESSQVLRNVFGLPIEVITGGAPRGINLFHSFREFNVSEGRSAFFFSPSTQIQNILARVTGNNRSDILGTLGVFSSTQTNLFLINPSGFVFGENAALNVNGSFVATTANGVSLGETGLFSANEPARSNLLSVNPSALFYNAVNNQAQIRVNRSLSGLQVPNGKSLSLVGGDISIDGGRLNAPGGRVELGGLAGVGTVGIAINNGNVSLNFASNTPLSNVELKNDARVNTRGTGGGDIFVRANNFTATSGGRLASGTEGAGNGGNITVNANNVNFSGEGIIFGSGIYNVVAPGSLGNAGNIFINSRAFSATNGGTIRANTGGIGNGGNVEIISTDSFKLIDGNIDTRSVDVSTGNAGNISITTGAYIASGSNAYLNSGTLLTGQNAGNIILNADSIILENGSEINSSNIFGFGNAGKIDINAKKDINLSGDSSILAQSAGQGSGGAVTIKTNGSISFINSDIFTNVSLGSNGQAGDINIQASSLSMSDNSDFLASAFQEGNAGNIAIQTTDFINLNNNSQIAANNSTKAGGNISLLTRQLKLNNSSISGAALGSGAAGSLIIKATDEVEVSGLSKLTMDTIGNGNAGNLRIDTKKLTIQDGSRVSSSALGDNGAGGNIEINASDDVEITGTTPDGLTSSSIGTDTAGAGAAGNVKINTSRLIVRDGSTVSSFAVPGSSGKGGNIEINASESVEVSGMRPRSSSSSRIDTESSGTGNAGNIKISTGKLMLLDAGQISASTFASGLGGKVDINASNSIQIDGQRLNGFSASGIFSKSQPALTEALGKGGDIEIKTPSLNISNGGQINATALGTGDAGSIRINVDNFLNMRTGDIATSSARSSGGNIQIQAGNIRLFDDSDITTFVNSGAGGGGDINLTANTIIALGDSDILSFARDGKGGNINFNTTGFFNAPLYRPGSALTTIATRNQLERNNRADVNASGAISGAVTGVPDITFIEESLTDLPNNQVDTNALIANSCIARTANQNSTFFVVGKGGIPLRPDDASLPNYSTGAIRSLETASRRQAWKSGDAVVEATGVYELSNGKLMLSRECN